MKKSFISKIFILLICCFSFSSCEELKKIVSVNNLPGEWELVAEGPNYIKGGSVIYAFEDYGNSYDDNGSCYIDIYDDYTDTYISTGYDYVVSPDNEFITLYYRNSSQYYEQYFIEKISSYEMILTRTLPSRGETLYFDRIN